MGPDRFGTSLKGVPELIPRHEHARSVVRQAAVNEEAPGPSGVPEAVALRGKEDN